MSHTGRSLFVLMLTLAGCSTFQTNLAPEGLVPGKTTSGWVMEHYGEPRGIDTITGPTVPKRTSLFRYGVRQTQPPEMFRNIWQVFQKNLILEFLNDTLHGYLYNSSFNNHPTDFDKHLRRKILIGRGTKADVLSLLGEPVGKVLMPTSLFDHPMLAPLRHIMPTNAREGWCYYYDYSYFKAGIRRRFEYYKFLVIYFDDAGTVVDKFYGESDKTEPKGTQIFVQ